MTPTPGLNGSGEIVITGNIAGGGSLTIDGKVVGDINMAFLKVGPAGHVEGNLMAEIVEVEGSVKGIISGRLVKLSGEARVDGDLYCEKLSMAPGAQLEGRCTTLPPAA